MNRNVVSFKLGISDDGKEISVNLGNYGVSSVLVDGTEEDSKNIVVSNILYWLSRFSEEYAHTYYYGKRDISVLTSSYTSRISKIYDDISEVSLVSGIRDEINNRLRVIRKVCDINDDDFGIDTYNTLSESKLVRKVYVIEHTTYSCDYKEYSLKKELEKLVVGELATYGGLVGISLIIITDSGNNYLTLETLRNIKCNVFLNVIDKGDNNNKYASVCFNRKDYMNIKLLDAGKNLL